VDRSSKAIFLKPTRRNLPGNKKAQNNFQDHRLSRTEKELYEEFLKTEEAALVLEMHT
jgi:hypothetical protein